LLSKNHRGQKGRGEETESATHSYCLEKNAGGATLGKERVRRTRKLFAAARKKQRRGPRRAPCPTETQPSGILKSRKGKDDVVRRFWEPRRRKKHGNGEMACSPTGGPLVIPPSRTVREQTNGEKRRKNPHRREVGKAPDESKRAKETRRQGISSKENRFALKDST